MALCLYTEGELFYLPETGVSFAIKIRFFEAFKKLMAWEIFSVVGADDVQDPVGNPRGEKQRGPSSYRWEQELCNRFPLQCQVQL